MNLRSLWLSPWHWHVCNSHCHLLLRCLCHPSVSFLTTYIDVHFHRHCTCRPKHCTSIVLVVVLAPTNQRLSRIAFAKRWWMQNAIAPVSQNSFNLCNHWSDPPWVSKSATDCLGLIGWHSCVQSQCWPCQDWWPCATNHVGQMQRHLERLHIPRVFPEQGHWLCVRLQI